MHRTLFTVLTVFYFNIIIAQPSGRKTISGFVNESQSSELLIGVNVYIPDLKIGTVTNTYGFYSITLPASDSISVIFSCVGFASETKKMNLRSDQEINISLNSNLQIDEVVVSASRNEKMSESVKMSIINLPISQIKDVPTLLGEKDVLKVIQLMPGVQKGSEGSSGIYVRGGGPDQNLIILDDAIVYNASHLFGFFSLFNGDALKSVELTKGGFPARYGGRLSSVLDMNMKEGNKEKWHGEGGIGLISSRLTIEGPLLKNKSSILLSGRRTYFDFFIRPFMKKETGIFGYYFYDFNAKINYDFGRKNKLYLSGYFGRDKFFGKAEMDESDEDFGIFWGNATGTLRWNHLFTNKVFSNTSVIFSNYKFSIYEKFDDKTEDQDYNLDYYSGIRDLTLKYDIDYLPSPKHSVKFGAVGILHTFTPSAIIEVDQESNIDLNEVKTIDGIESAVYIEDTWNPVQRLKVNAGARFSQFFASEKEYYFLEPRISAAWRFNNNIAAKASYAEMSQYIHLLSNTGGSLPTDLWVPTTDRVKPQQSKQLAAGIVKDLTNHDLSISVEGYYKTMTNIIGYKEGASFLVIDESGSANEFTWQDNVVSGKGLSYGSELLIQKKVGKFSGWVGYTISWTKHKFDSLNFGKEFYPRFDRRHDISIVGIYKISPRITLSGSWVYGTGNSITLPVSQYSGNEHQITNSTTYNYYGNGLINEYGEKNSFRMRAYHRFDIGIQFHKKKSWGERIWEISVYNAYNRKNPYFYYIQQVSENGVSQRKLTQFSLFPIIPSISYSFKF